MTDLKPCPFCGGEADLFAIDKDLITMAEDCQVICRDCYAMTTHYYTPAEAIAAWNTRADGWIPVAPETMPLTYEYIWVTDGEIVKPGYFTGYDFYVENQLWNRHATHWMPKPKPPAKREEVK